MTDTPGKHVARLQELLRENGWTLDTRLFRGTLPQFLTRTAEAPGGGDGVVRISANDDPPEAVVDIYGHDHTLLARDMGQGLAFVASQDHEWRGSDRAYVSVRIGDVIEQGGRIYPVASTVTEPTWYLTLPSGGVEVREAD